jgi:hypothetical protein
MLHPSDEGTITVIWDSWFVLRYHHSGYRGTVIDRGNQGTSDAT